MSPDYPNTPAGQFKFHMDKQSCLERGQLTLEARLNTKDGSKCWVLTLPDGQSLFLPWDAEAIQSLAEALLSAAQYTESGKYDQ